VIAIAVISATYIFVVPGFVTSETISTSIIESTTVEPTPKFSPVREPTEIESLINDIMLHNAGNKGAYSHNPDKTNDVHVCMNMAVDQAIWISENYEYNVGIVLLHRRTLGDNHVQTSVVVNGTQYVIDSTSHYYWTADEHVSQWSGIYGIQYTTVEKGIELEKENNEMLNNKNESQSMTPNNDVVFVMDTSTSMFSSEIVVNTGRTFFDCEKIMVINSLDDFKDDRVGMVAFGGKAYEVSGLTYLGNDAARESLKETIMTIEPKGELTTTLDQGLAMAEEMLSNSVGSKDVIIISDGIINMEIYNNSLSVADRMNNADVEFHFIHLINSPPDRGYIFEDLADDIEAEYQQVEYQDIFIN
jgi:hypothetical protein